MQRIFWRIQKLQNVHLKLVADILKTITYDIVHFNYRDSNILFR